MLEQKGFDLQSICPTKGAKFSPNLFKWLSQFLKRTPRVAQVYRCNDGVMWIGFLHEGDLIGARLMAVLCNGKSEHPMSYRVRSNFVSLTPIPDFWVRYAEDGRCAIDPEHQVSFINDDSRWSVHGDTRSCMWCGKANQVLHRWTQAVHRQEWRSSPPTPQINPEAGSESIQPDGPAAVLSLPSIGAEPPPSQAGIRPPPGIS